jgi:hypothetical protein
MLFVYSMLAMGLGAAVVGLVQNKAAWLGGLHDHRHPNRASRKSGGLLLLAVAVASTLLFRRLQAVTGASGSPRGAPAVAGFVNAFLPPAASIPTALLLLVIAVNASALAVQPSAQVVTLFNTGRYAEAKTALLLTAN